jgi:hypothetical protein
LPAPAARSANTDKTHRSYVRERPGYITGRADRRVANAANKNLAERRWPPPSAAPCAALRRLTDRGRLGDERLLRAGRDPSDLLD